MESLNLIKDFVAQTGATEEDAVRCLNSWGWDLKRALIDYNDTLTTEYFRNFNEKSTSNHKNNENDYKKLSRGISTAMDNVNIVSNARTEIAMDFDYETLKDNLKLTDTHDYTFILPDLSSYSEEFRQFLESDLIDISTLKSLEETKRLNWWVDTGLCRKLWPLSTTGDGNCLLHAASLGMWGFHDRKLTLRSALNELLSKGNLRDAIWRRWRFQQTKLNKKAGFVYSEVEWCKEWDEIVALSSTAPRQSFEGNARRRSAILEKSGSIDGSEIYESLEEIHVLALAHVLKRAIIVVSDTVLRDMNGEAMAPIPFGGIYLPFEVDADECYKGPLLLTYNNAHFSALVSMETNHLYPPALIPIIDLNNEVLPLQFCIDPGRNFKWTNYDGGDECWALSDQEQITLLKEYLIITYTCLSENLDYEIFENLTDEEFEKGLQHADVAIAGSVGVVSSANGNEAHQNKSKAAKQLHSIAKQFGSIGKSVSKKIKKNIDSLARKGSKKLNSSESFNSQTRIPCAELKSKRHGYHNQMIENYLICAHIRFVELENSKTQTMERKTSSSNLGGLHVNITNQIDLPPPTYTAFQSQSNVCYDCPTSSYNYDNNVNDLIPKYGTGNSKFYLQADLATHSMVKDLPFAKSLNELDHTIYLTNSTFFNDDNFYHRNIIDQQSMGPKTVAASHALTKPTDSGYREFPS